MKKAIKYVSALCLIMVVAVMMTACGGGDSNNKNPLEQLQGLYGNIENKTVYYFSGDKYYFTQINLGEEKENGLCAVKFVDYTYSWGSYSEGIIKLNVGEKYQYVQRKMTFYDGTDNFGINFINCKSEKNNDLSTGFTTIRYKDQEPKGMAKKDARALQENECGTYNKILSLTNFIEQIYPASDGYLIDYDDLSGAFGVWQGLFQM